MAVGRGLDPDPGVDGALRPARRDAAGLQLRLAAGAVVGRGLRRRHPRHAGRGRRRSAPRRPGCCPTTTSCGTPPGTAAAPVGLARARAATLTMLALPGLGVPLPGRGARPRGGRRRAGVPAGPGVVPHRRRRPRRLPACRSRGAARRPPYGFSPAGTQTWLPMPDDWADAHRRRPAQGPRRRRGRSTATRCGRGGGSPTPATTSRWSTRGRRVLELRRGPLTVGLQLRLAGRCGCPPARSSSAAAPSTTACSPRTPRPGSSDTVG